jgi:hypothetical protein
MATAARPAPTGLAPAVPPPASISAHAASAAHHHHHRSSVASSTSFGESPDAPGGIAAGGRGTSGNGAPPAFAVWLGLLVIAAIWTSKLVTPPAAWRSAIVVSVIERPG